MSWHAKYIIFYLISSLDAANIEFIIVKLVSVFLIFLLCLQCFMDHCLYIFKKGSIYWFCGLHSGLEKTFLTSAFYRDKMHWRKLCKCQNSTALSYVIENHATMKHKFIIFIFIWLFETVYSSFFNVRNFYFAKVQCLY